MTRPILPEALNVADQISTDVRAAMKAGDKTRVGQLRLLLSELNKDAKEGKGDEMAVLRRERKRRREAEKQFRDAGRDELAAAEAEEATLIETYLPEEVSAEQIDELVRAAIGATGATGPRDMGKVIAHVMAAAGGNADGAQVAARAKAALA